MNTYVSREQNDFSSVYDMINPIIENWAQHLYIDMKIVESTLTDFSASKHIDIQVFLHPDIFKIFTKVDVYKSLSDEMSRYGLTVQKNENSLTVQIKGLIADFVIV